MSASAILKIALPGIYGYHNNQKVPFLRVTVAIPKLVSGAKRILEGGFNVPGYSTQAYSIFESDIAYVVR
jgi:DNA polymerase delta subunit 1